MKVEEALDLSAEYMLLKWRIWTLSMSKMKKMCKTVVFYGSSYPKF